MMTTNKTTLKAPDVVCGGCTGSIKNALSKIEGIKQVEVDVDTKNVLVEHDEKVSREKLETILDDIGFPVEN
ncbi:MAG: heavy-metal-associated domain-containing protein [Acidobacteriota bacterium]|nr:heavy-metal-associated domain-containing protein [Acidobacteriota bacterium]